VIIFVFVSTVTLLAQGPGGSLANPIQERRALRNKQLQEPKIARTATTHLFTYPPTASTLSVELSVFAPYGEETQSRQT
jgi:hypothetical protein